MKLRIYLFSLSILLAALITQGCRHPLEALSPAGPAGGAGAPSSAEQAALIELAEEIIAGVAGDYAKVAAIYDWVTSHIAYDLDKYEDIMEYNYPAETGHILDTRKGVCHDYAQLTRDLLQAAGLTATYQSGEVLTESGRRELHAWNYVLVEGLWHAADTTWGAGFVLEEEKTFIQKPRRLYLTTPEELRRLHADPEYKAAQEARCSREWSANQEAVVDGEMEEQLLQLINRYRADRDLRPLSAELHLQKIAREHAHRLAAAECGGDDFSLEDLSREVREQAASIRLLTAGVTCLAVWSYTSSTAEDIMEELAAESATYLLNPMYTAAALSVVRRGDVSAVIILYIDRY